jgi:hypothetical protein
MQPHTKKICQYCPEHHPRNMDWEDDVDAATVDYWQKPEPVMKKRSNNLIR